jgi:elongation factor 1-alpha
VGHLLYQCGAVDRATIDRYERESAAAGKESGNGVKFAWITDTIDVERERGCSVDVSLWPFQSQNYALTMIDTPGQVRYLKNMIAGLTQADIGLLVVSANAVDNDDDGGGGANGPAGHQKRNEDSHLNDVVDGKSSNSSPSQQQLQSSLREHVLLAYSFGVKQLVVAINQMDRVVDDVDDDTTPAATAAVAEQVYQRLRRHVSDILRQIGYKPMKVSFVPTNAWGGDNLVHNQSSSMLSWYDGPTILQALDQCTPPHRRGSINKPLRMPIQDVYKIGGIGTVVVGRIATGIVQVGDVVTIVPSSSKSGSGAKTITGTVQSVEIHHASVERGRAGDNVGLCLKGVVARTVKRGQVLSIAAAAAKEESSSPLVVTARPVESFVAQVIFLDHAVVKATVGYRPVLDVHTAHVSCEFVRLVSKIDRRTGDVLDEHPTVLRGGEAGIVELRPVTPLSLEAFGDFASLGRFCIRGDDKHVVAVGVANSIVGPQRRRPR